MGLSESQGERYQVKSNKEAMEGDLDFIIMMRTSGLFKKGTERT